MNLFKPGRIRDALDKRDGFKERKREEAYRLLSNYASHPTHAGFKLFSPRWMSKLGPFYDAGYLKAMLEELAKRLPASAEAYVRFFAKVALQVEAARRHYLERLNGWAQTYLRGGIGSEHVGPDQRGQR